MFFNVFIKVKKHVFYVFYLQSNVFNIYAENPEFGANSVHVSSKVPELWLLEVAIGCNAHFWVKNMENVNFY